MNGGKAGSCGLALAAALALGAPAAADIVEIAGPDGSLAAARIAVEGARHVVVLIPGSGPIDRDGNSPDGLRSDTYRLLAEALASRGVASLRVDKRGFFGSAAAVADPNDVTIAGYAADARAWVERAAAEAPCVWIAGHSEGGLVALAATAEAPEALCGLILIAAPGRPVGRLLVDQARALPGNAALMPEIEAIVADLEVGRGRDPAMISAPLQPLFAAGVQGYMIDLFAHDPAEMARRWAGPALIVQAGADMQVPPPEADILAGAMPQAARLDLAGATHMLKLDVPGQPFLSYTDPTLPLHPELAPGIVAFLDEAGR